GHVQDEGTDRGDLQARLRCRGSAAAARAPTGTARKTPPPARPTHCSADQGDANCCRKAAVTARACGRWISVCGACARRTTIACGLACRAAAQCPRACG